ncbi:carboxypeptidase-like regulatory domain-containing protein [Roseivirga sp. BDSF3-8]|uniref:TonB-dependent receptor n=1 Tax=Roseivirga sp. BDSF3-8 TaxID=3241598 RepID=UPI003531CE5A
MIKRMAMLRAITLVSVMVWLLPLGASAHQGVGVLSGRTITAEGKALPAVNISIRGIGIGTISKENGAFELRLPAGDSVKVLFTHVGYYPTEKVVRLRTGEEYVLEVQMREETMVLEQVEVGSARETEREQAGVTKLSPKSLEEMPSPFGDISRLLATLPGVIANNELSSSYTVRGGNFDENLVYVNGIQVYRPFLIRAGQQEGLSFINPDLVESIEFSAGGWQPRYGDKLSSSLTVNYKKPEEHAASVSIGLLGGRGHVEGKAMNGRLRYIGGVRHKNSRYLLNTFETQGQYLPRFTDGQAYVTYQLKRRGNKPVTELSALLNYASNRYLVRPEARETTFGTFNRVLRLFVAFDGQELLDYDTWQTGLKLSHNYSDRLRVEAIVSALTTREREYIDLEGGYRLCDVNRDPSSPGFNQCVAIRGVGTEYNYARNRLDANIYAANVQTFYNWKKTQTLLAGIGYRYQDVSDRIREWGFIDSADFVKLDVPIQNDISLNINRFSAFVQNTSEIGERQVLTYGVRANYLDVTGQFLLSPRLQYSYHLPWERDVVFRFATGIYRQPPFYREFRDRNGQLQENVKAQSSLHVISGVDYDFKLWNRPFKFITEAYYKYLWDVNTYDVDNVLIRYFADNTTKAYAIGADFRISGEFIPNTDSWFSLGLLRTREDIEDDGQDFIRRPSDQLVNIGIFFQDHFPSDPTIRVNVGVFFGSGLPFGPPNEPQYRSALNGESYQRVDVGFSKIFLLDDNSGFGLKSIWVGADILNMLGTENAISYTWIRDITNTEFAIPNSLSARFLNIRIVGKFN